MELCTKDEICKLHKLYAFMGKRKVMLFDALEYLRGKGYYVMAMPEPYYMWRVWLCILGKPNTHDGKLNATLIDKVFESRDDAWHYALNMQLDIMIEADRNAFRMTDEEVDALRKECREAGFDV